MWWVGFFGGFYGAKFKGSVFWVVVFRSEKAHIIKTVYAKIPVQMAVENITLVKCSVLMN